MTVDGYFIISHSFGGGEESNMDEQTQASSQEEQQEVAAIESDGSGGLEPEATDWQHIAEIIVTEAEKKQPTFQVVPVTLFGEDAELRIINKATVGELLVSFLLLLAIVTFCLRWLFKVVWGR